MTKYFSPAELADLLGASSAEQVLEWRRQYRWPSLKIGKTIRFSEEHVEQIVAQHTARPEKPADDVALPALAGQTRRSARRSA